MGRAQGASMRRCPASTSVYCRSPGSNAHLPKIAPAFLALPPSTAVKCIRKGIRAHPCHQYRDRIEKRGFRFDPPNRPSTIRGTHPWVLLRKRYMGLPVTSIAIESKSAVFASIRRIVQARFAGPIHGSYFESDTWDSLSPVSRSNRKTGFSLRSAESSKHDSRDPSMGPISKAIHGTLCHQYRDRIEKRGFRFDPPNRPSTIRGTHPWVLFRKRYMGLSVTSIAIESKNGVFASIRRIVQARFAGPIHGSYFESDTWDSLSPVSRSNRKTGFSLRSAESSKHDSRDPSMGPI